MDVISLKDEKACVDKLTALAAHSSTDYFIGEITWQWESEIAAETINTNYFRVYKARPLFTYTGTSLSNFMALIQIKDKQAHIVIKIKRPVLVFTIIWYLFLGTLSAYLLWHHKFIGVVFSIFMLIAPISFLREKRRFRSLIINSLNNFY